MADHMLLPSRIDAGGDEREYEGRRDYCSYNNYMLSTAQNDAGRVMFVGFNGYQTTMPNPVAPDLGEHLD